MASIALHNRYICMRHAQSIANEKHIIVSDPLLAVQGYGLTPQGHKQVLYTVTHTEELHQVTHIYTSDFLRAYQTAMIVAQYCNNAPVITDTRLRERYFGQFEGTSSDNYHKVWDMDCHLELDVTCYDVEPVHKVAKRMLSFLLDCEKIHNSKVILVVSHGDPLQILYAIANGVPANQFRTLPHFENAEIRILPSYFHLQEEFVL